MDKERSFISIAGLVSIFSEEPDNEKITSSTSSRVTFSEVILLRKLDTLINELPDIQGDIESGLYKLTKVILLLICLVNNSAAKILFCKMALSFFSCSKLIE